MNQIAIEIGSGKKPKPGYIHVDIVKLPGVNVVSTAWSLPFASGSVGQIYSRHCLEHLTLAQFLAALKEYRRVLAPKGKMELILPDIAYHFKQYFMKGKSPLPGQDVTNRYHALASIYGWQKSAYDFHKWGYDEEYLLELITEAGFKGYNRLSDRDWNLHVVFFNPEIEVADIPDSITVSKQTTSIPGSAIKLNGTGKIGLVMATGSDEREYGYPLSLGYLSAFIKQHKSNYEVMIGERPEDLIEFEPDVVGISSVSSCFSDVSQIADIYPDAIKVVGGQHITFLPESLPKNIQYGVLGEGEAAFLNLLDKVKGGDDPASLPNVISHENMKTYDSSKQVLPANIPFPTRKLNNVKEATLFTSRGCPFNCDYCSSCRFWGKPRFFPAEYVVDEIELLTQQYPRLETIVILDDLFAAHRKRLRQIVRLMRERELNHLRFRSFIRADTFDEETLELLKELNFFFIRFGAETGSDRLLGCMKGNHSSIEQNQRVIDLCIRNNMPVGASFMVGYPSETYEDIYETIRFIRENRPRGLKVSGFYLTMPFPGTPIWDQAIERGLIDLDDFEWSRLNLSFSNPDFGKGMPVYMNEDNIPYKDLIRILKSEGLLK
ncbi:MAG: radical SAM protein [Calditrichaeota bacterium]|nr:radical SAM protein [Calditrichota bacterium]